MCMCVCYDDILGILLTKHHVLNSDDRISCQFHGVDLCQKSNFMSYIGTVRKQSDVACGFLAFVPSENSFYCQCCKLKPMFTGRYSSAQGSITAQGVEQKWYCTNQVIEEQTKSEQGPDATNKEELVGDIKVGGSLGCCDHRIVEFRILKDGRKAKSRTTILDFRRADFNLFRDLLGRFPWFMALDRRGIQESWLLKSIPKSRKSSVGGRRPVWMCKQC